MTSMNELLEELTTGAKVMHVILEPGTSHIGRVDISSIAGESAMVESVDTFEKRFENQNKQQAALSKRIEVLTNRVDDQTARIEAFEDLVEAFYEDLVTSQIVEPGRWERLVSWFKRGIHGKTGAEE